MKVFAFIVVLFFLASVRAEDFHQPQPYGADRYEAVWMKNPFTLKTAPAAVVKESFAKDLAISSIFTLEDDTTVNVVNTKTREQMRFSNKEERKGMKIKSVNVRDTRGETSVELESGGETAVLKYDESYIKIAGTNAGQPKALNPNQMLPGGVPGAPGMQPVPVAQPGGQPLNGNRPPNVPLPQPVGVAQPFNAPNVPSPPMRRQLTAPTPRVPVPAHS